MKNEIIEKDDYYVMIVNRKDGTNFEVKLDEKGLDKIKDHRYKWYASYNKSNDSYYIQSTVYKGIVDGKPRNKVIYLHRVLMDVSEYGEVVDHINFDTMDNRYENLRVINKPKNSTHRKGINSNNSTGVRNVSYDKRSHTYIVQIQIDGKNTKVGNFKDIEDAEKCAIEYREKIYISALEE